MLYLVFFPGNVNHILADPAGHHRYSIYARFKSYKSQHYLAVLRNTM
jgi:hypothetical protein